MKASGSGDHTAWTSRPTDFCFSVPGSAFAGAHCCRVNYKFAPRGAIYPGTLVAIAMWVRCTYAKVVEGRHIPEVPTALLLFVAVYLGYRGLKPPSP
jgi:hypothetical protein